MTIDEAIAEAERAIEATGEGFWGNMQVDALNFYLAALRKAREEGLSFEAYQASMEPYIEFTDHPGLGQSETDAERPAPTLSDIYRIITGPPSDPSRE